jgi:hypothetical protein
VRTPRISIGTALVAMVVTGTTASAFALSGGNVPSALSFQSASTSKAASVEEPKRPPLPKPTTTTTAKPAHTEPRPTEPKPVTPIVTTTTSAPGHHEEARPATTVTTVAAPSTTVPVTGPKPEPRVEHPTTTVVPTTAPPVTEPTRVEPTTTSSTSPRTTATTEKHVDIPVTMTLTCGTAVVNGMNAMSCGWTQSDNPAFASYRFFRSTDSGAGQILFTSTNPAKHSWGTTTGLTTGESSTYTVQALDASGHILATSPQVVVACCSQSFAK